LNPILTLKGTESMITESSCGWCTSNNKRHNRQVADFLLPDLLRKIKEDIKTAAILKADYLLSRSSFCAADYHEDARHWQKPQVSLKLHRF